VKTFDIIVETTKGSRHKYDYDPVSRFFKLKKIMPEGMTFPYDFGFIPGTKGEDGDPLDIIVISESGTFTGCMIECRVIGGIKGIQEEKGKELRNDRFLAVPVTTKIFEKVHEVDDLPGKIIEELGSFFINYNKAAGKKFTVAGILSAKKSYSMIEEKFLEK
jgi:inorganic pyrophosphatase